MCKVEVKGIGISLNGKNVLLSLEDAKALQRELNALFGRLPWYPDWGQLPSPVTIEEKVWPFWGPPSTSPGTAPIDRLPPTSRPGVWCSIAGPPGSK